MTVVPVWIALFVSIGSLLLTLVSTLVAHRRNRIDARELEWRSRREQVMRMLQWAADLAIDPDPRRSALGLRQLQALAWSRLNSSDVQAFVNAALDVLNLLNAPVEEADPCV